MKVQVLSVQVRHARLDDDTFFPTHPHTPLPAELETPAPVISWGATTGVAQPASMGGEERSIDDTSGWASSVEDPRSASDVRRCLLEYLRGLSPPVNADGLGPGAESPAAARSLRRRGLRPSAHLNTLKSAPASPPPWVPTPYPRTKAGPACALQYRLLKRKRKGSEGSGGGGIFSVVATSTSTCHDVSLGPLRAYLTEALLEQLLIFSGVGGLGGYAGQGGKAPVRGSTAPGAGGIVPARPNVTSSGIAAQGLDESQRTTRRASRSPRATDTGTTALSPRVPSIRPSIATSETSLHLVLLSADVALDLTAAREDCQREADSSSRWYASTVDTTAFLILSIGQADISGSESASYFAVADDQHAWHTSAASDNEVEDKTRQRVCSLSLDALSIVFLDGSSLATTAKARTGCCSPRFSPRVSRSLAERVFGGDEAADVAAKKRLIRLRGCRVTAEIISTKPDMASLRSRPGSGVHVVFNASCDALHACASVGTVLLILEVLLLAQKIESGGSRDTYNSFSNHKDEISGQGCRWTCAWKRGVTISSDGLSIGGTVKSGTGLMRGNARRLSVGRVGYQQQGQASESPSDVAVFEAPLEDGSEALSWSVDTVDAAGATGLMLTSNFKFAVLHYANAKKAWRELKSVWKEWEVVAAVAGRFGREQAAAASAPQLSYHASSGTQEKHSGPVQFDIRGSVVAMHLPFELSLKVEHVRVKTRRVPQSLATGRTAGTGRTGNADLTIDLFAGDVRVIHALYGARSSSKDTRPSAIRCAARGVVTLKPTINATSVSLESEHVHVRLTPAFCAAFGAFVRFMVGPPARPVIADAADSTNPNKRPAASFRFELGVREVDVDFETGPCSPWGVSANLLVGGVLMMQQTTTGNSPARSNVASFEMAFEKVEGTQERHPGRNAPSLPQEIVSLIRSQVGSGYGNDAFSFYVFTKWVAERTRVGVRGDAHGAALVQPFVIPLEGGAERAPIKARAFSLVSTTSGPRHRLVNSLTLKISPTLLACYPPIVRLLVGHYNRFGGQAFRSFRSRADLPQRRIGQVNHDVDIRGCSAVLLASLATGARGIHVSAGQVTVKEKAMATAAPEAATNASSPWTHVRVPAEKPLATSGFVGPVGLTFVQDWRCLLPSPATWGFSGTASGNHAQLCVPIDLRWTVSYDPLGRFRQDISLSSVQLYLEQIHFDLCARLAQVFAAADFPGAFAPKTSRASPVSSCASDTDIALAHTAPREPELAASATAERTPGAGNDLGASKDKTPGRDHVESFLNLSMRLPLLQVVLAMGKREGSTPPLLEIDVASVRFARGALTVRHVSINSWPQEVGVAAVAPAGDREGGYRVLERSGHSKESGKDFMRMEVQCPTSGASTRSPSQAYIDIIFQVNLF